jgi:ABC-type antimicrobial peptide transport system permease subunit
MRAALGAARGRIVRLLVTEALVLAVPGGLAGAGLGYVLVQILFSTAPPWIPHLEEVRLDGPVFAAILLLTVGAGLASGLVLAALLATLVPLRRALPVDPARTLRSE